MSDYNFRRYKLPKIETGWRDYIEEAGLDPIEITITNVIGLKLENFRTMIEEAEKDGKSVRHAEIGLTIRRMYDEAFPAGQRPTERCEKRIAKRSMFPGKPSLRGKTCSEQWAIVKHKAKLDDHEIDLAKLMYMTPEQVLSMIPTGNTKKKEDWKDSPALHIRRLYDEQHVHPALTTYWDLRRHQSPFSKTYLREQAKKAEKRAGKLER